MTPTTATAYYTMILGARTELDVATDARAAGASIRDYLVDAHDAAVRCCAAELRQRVERGVFDRGFPSPPLRRRSCLRLVRPPPVP